MPILIENGFDLNELILYCMCFDKIPIKLAKDTCHKAAETGNCQNYEARWYYDTKEERCRQFYYGGCGGNDNNFGTEDACLSRCERKQPPPQQQPPPPPPPSQSQPDRDNEVEPFQREHCFLESDAGPCRAIQRKYYYNSRDGVCDVFAYGGCGGNQNNFDTIEDCEDRCGNVQNECTLPPVRGRCQENVTRFYYDQRTDQCYQFDYSGCRGNKNNFYTADECAARCQQRQQQQQQQRPTPPSVDDVRCIIKLIESAIFMSDCNLFIYFCLLARTIARRALRNSE